MPNKKTKQLLMAFLRSLMTGKALVLGLSLAVAMASIVFQCFASSKRNFVESVRLSGRLPQFSTDNFDEFHYGTQSKSAIPSEIYAYWDSEKDAVPLELQKFFHTWHDNASNYTVHFYTRDTLPPEFQYILQLRHADTPHRVADFLRLAVLAKYGGIWMDVSVILNESLDWVHAWQQALDAEYVGYVRQVSTSRPEWPVIDNWFMASIPQSRFVNLWKNEFFRMNEYEHYMDYVQETHRHYNIQNISTSGYFTMHLAQQRCFQDLNHTQVPLQLALLKAENGPLAYLEEHKEIWKGGVLAREGLDPSPLLKLTRWRRVAYMSEFRLFLFWLEEYVIKATISRADCWVRSLFWTLDDSESCPP